MEEGASAGALTGPSLWDEYWARTRLPARVDPSSRWQAALADRFRAVLPHTAGLRLFELGCAPGRWLLFFHEEFGYAVSGCDTSALGVELVRRNLELAGCPGRVYQADARAPATLPAEQYDLVMSLGLIEHFESPDAVLESHVRLLAPSGWLVVSVPNLLGLNAILLRLAGMREMFEWHNVEVMSPEYFRPLARRFGLQCVFLDYVGGFDPGLMVFNYNRKVHGRWNVRILPLWAVERLLRHCPAASRRLMRVNGAGFSHMLLGIFRR